MGESQLKLTTAAAANESDISEIDHKWCEWLERGDEIKFTWNLKCWIDFRNKQGSFGVCTQPVRDNVTM